MIQLSGRRKCKWQITKVKSPKTKINKVLDAIKWQQREKRTASRWRKGWSVKLLLFRAAEKWRETEFWRICPHSTLMMRRTFPPQNPLKWTLKETCYKQSHFPELDSIYLGVWSHQKPWHFVWSLEMCHSEGCWDVHHTPTSQKAHPASQLYLHPQLQIMIHTLYLSRRHTSDIFLALFMVKKPQQCKIVYIGAADLAF